MAHAIKYKHMFRPFKIQSESRYVMVNDKSAKRPTETEPGGTSAYAQDLNFKINLSQKKLH